MTTTIVPHQLQGVYVCHDNKRPTFYTKNLVPGNTVYGEQLVRKGNDEYREWDVRKSKLGAAVAKGISQIGVKPGSLVLYLGCASGTSVSHVSDIVGKEGVVFALDVAPRPLRDIIPVSMARKNISPILADAHFPEQYAHRIIQCDVVFQDIAQKDQAEIFLKNCKLFLKKGGFGLLSVKAKSIDVTKNPRQLFDMVKQKVEKDLVLVDQRNLEPFEQDHCLFVWKTK